MYWVFWKHLMDASAEALSSPASVASAPSLTSRPLPSSQRLKASSPSSVDADAMLARFGREAMVVLDPALICYHVTVGWENISGFSPQEDSGHGLAEHIAPDHVQKLQHYLVQQDLQAAPVRFQIKHKNRQWRWCELQLLHAEHSAREKPVLYHCIIRDVQALATALHQAETAKLEAELAIKSRSEFLANMSHELRTPLNAIMGFTQIMESGMFGELGHAKYHEYVGNIQESGATLLSKINDLLQLAAIDSGEFMLQEAPADITEIIRQAIEFHSHRAFSQHVTLRNRLPQQPVMAYVDRIRMLQVMTNVLSNAIKYNDAHGSVDVYCDITKEGGIDVVIEDTGGGIGEHHLENILSAFRQENSFFARSRDCVGLGLALAKEIVKLHQGRIDIDSEPGRGTLLSIHLPKSRTLAAAPLEQTA